MLWVILYNVSCLKKFQSYIKRTSKVVLSTDVGSGAFVSLSVKSVSPNNLKKVGFGGPLMRCLPTLLHTLDDFYVVFRSEISILKSYKNGSLFDFVLNYTNRGK